MPRITKEEYDEIVERAKRKRPEKQEREKAEKDDADTETEDQAQARLANYLEFLKSQGFVHRYTAIPNHTRTPYKSVLAKNRTLGLRKGLSDMLVVYQPQQTTDREPKPRLLFIEMKRAKGGSATPEQKEWTKTLDSCEGVRAEICHGFGEAKALVNELVFGIPAPEKKTRKTRA